MKIATAAEMRGIDKAAIEYFGIPGLVLMENAGAALARQVASILTDAANKKVCVFAGKGNNGGDGFVAARHLASLGAKVKVFLVFDEDDMAGDAQVNLNIIKKMGIDVLPLAGDRDWDMARVAATFADCIIDAMLGTGFSGAIQGNMARAVELVNSAGKPVVAADIPSGVHADTGQVGTVAVRADYTVTFGLPKPGLLLYPGAEYTGRLVVADITIPAALLAADTIRQNAITARKAKQLLPRRHPAAHKGTNGHVAIVAGSEAYTGAAALAATGALRAGAGLVTLGVAASLLSLMQMKLTEIMTRPLPEIVGGAIGMKAVPYIEELTARCDVLAIGPGLGRAEETMAAVREVVRNCDKPLVIDADGLNALVGHTDILRDTAALAVLTPHPGEMGRLFGLTPAQVNQDRIGVARQAAHSWGAIVVLKGAPTVVAFPDGEVYVNTSGNAGMATGGTGDVLTGVIAALIAQGLSSHDAAVAGVYLHGLAGDIAARAGQVGMAAGDVARALPAAYAGLLEE